MTDQERIAQLEAENAAQARCIAELREQVATLEAQVQHLRARLAKDSHNRSKPPSSDGLSRRPRSQRVQTGRKTGSQPGHPGHALVQVAVPDVQVVHRPAVCSVCQCPLAGVGGQVVERRQVQDVPPPKLVVTQHQVEAGCGPIAPGRAGLGLCRGRRRTRHQQSGRTRPADGERAAEDFGHLPQPGRGDRLLSHSQLSLHDAQARPGAAARAQCCLSGSAFACLLGQLSSYPLP